MRGADQSQDRIAGQHNNRDIAQPHKVRPKVVTPRKTDDKQFPWFQAVHTNHSYTY